MPSPTVAFEPTESSPSIPSPTPPFYPTSPALSGVEPVGAGNCAPSGNPAEGILSQRYHRYHPGIDMSVPINTPVIATHSGIVTFADWSDIGYGFLVIIQNGQFISYYGHNTSFNVQRGMQVVKGSIVAWSGSSGNSSGPHIHYETRLNDYPIDPLTFASRGFPSC
jgi:murein DD-endopeptidase MepM/ murein hydrolase activator NlpD